MCLLSACSGNERSDPSTGAVPLALTGHDYAEIEAQYKQWDRFQFCPIVAEPTTFRAATITATGVAWGFGTFQPQPGCTYLNAQGQRVDPVQNGDFLPAWSGGVFEREPGAPWMMVSFRSTPFPCPVNPGDTPGPNRPWVPFAVLKAVGVHYASTGCDHIIDPPQAR
jgi:hypothetical protein